MTETAIENALRMKERLIADRDLLSAQMAEITRRLARIDQFISDHAMFTANSLPDDNKEVKPFNQASAPAVDAPRRRTNSKKEEVTRAAREIIEEAANPVQRSELYKALIDRGFRIEGSDPEGVMTTMLWRTRDMPGVVHLKSFGYWLTERDYPMAFYSPDDIFSAADDKEPMAPADYDEGADDDK